MVKQGDKLQQTGWTYLLTASSIATVCKANAMHSASSNIMLAAFFIC